MKRHLVQRSVAVVTLSVFTVSAAIGVAVDGWYARVALESTRSSVKTALVPYSNNVAAAVGRHVSRMAGLSAFVTSVHSREQLQAELALYADGLMASVPGIRAIQLIRDGRIAWVYPRQRNEDALGLSLRDNENARTRAGYKQAMEADGVTLFGPEPLVQGGEALVLDKRVRAPYDPSLDLVAMLVDMQAVIRDLRLASLPSDVAVEVRDASGRLVSSAGGPVPTDPVTLPAEVVGGAWELRGGPVSGWRAAVAPELVPARLAIAAIVVLLTLLAWQVAGRDARLTNDVEERTASLMQMVDEAMQALRRQEETDRALALSEERLRLALAASRTATYELDVAADRIEWSDEVGPLIGMPMGGEPSTTAEALRFLDVEDLRRVKEGIGEALGKPSHGTLEVRVHGTDGAVRWLTLHWLSRAESDGVVRRVVGTLTDVTERKRLEEQFLHAQKMQAMGALAGGIAHDFNNLLTVILGAGQMARASADAPGVPETMRVDIDDVLAAGERASVLTGQLLAFSRRQVVQPRHFDACDLVGGMGTMLRRLVGERIRVETALPGTKVPLFADHGQLTQVVMNLAVNARDAMPEGGVLRISLRTDGAPAGPALPNENLVGERFAVLSVSDSGVGIDPAIRDLIFDPFFTTKPVGHGTGLGLATVYGIVMQLGGTLRLTSALGRGTTFDVYLPLASMVAEEEPAPIVAATAADGTGRTVLLAEDEAGLRRVVERVLEGAGYTVLVAEDGAAALELARAHDGIIDLLVTDVVMPRLGGLELASTLARERPTMRVLLMSGYPRGAGQGTAVSLSDAPFVAKPFKPSDLLVAARRALAES